MPGWTVLGVGKGFVPFRDVCRGEEDAAEEVATRRVNPRFCHQRTRLEGGHVVCKVIQNLVDEFLGDPWIAGGPDRI